MFLMYVGDVRCVITFSQILRTPEYLFRGLIQQPVTSRKFGLKSLLYSELRNGVKIQLTKYIYGLYLCLRTFNMPMHHMLNARVVHYRFRTLLTPTRSLTTRPLPYAPQLH